MPTEYFFPMFPRLEPCTPWTGGRVTDIDVLTLSDAACMATLHAGQTVSVGDILRAAGRGEIRLRAIVHQSAKTEPCRADDALLNYGEPLPKGSIQTLPLTACKALANTGRAEWRTFDWFEQHNGELCRFARWQLADGEPDFETVPDDCRVTGNDIHALADAFKPIQATPVTAPGAAVGTPDALVVVQKAKRESPMAVALPYLREVYHAGKFSTVQVFIKSLTSKSGLDGSPFKKASLTDDTFYLIENGKSITHGTLKNQMAKVRTKS